MMWHSSWSDPSLHPQVLALIQLLGQPAPAEIAVHARRALVGAVERATVPEVAV